MREIDLTGQDVSDLGPLAAMTGLSSLRLTGNAAVTDLSALAGLPLANLGLSGTGVADLAAAGADDVAAVGRPRRDPGVRPRVRSRARSACVELDVARTRPSRDLSPLAGAASLSMLDVRDNRVADVTPLALDARARRALDRRQPGRWTCARCSTRPRLLGVDVEGLDLQTPGIDELRAQGVYVGGLA